LTHPRRFAALVIASAVISAVVAVRSGTQLRFLDEADYYNLATHVVQGDGFVNDALQPTAFRAPGYVLVLAPFAALDGGVLYAKLLNVVLLVAACFAARALLRARAPAYAWLAGALPLAYPAWIYTASTLYPQTLCLALLAALLALLHRDVLTNSSVNGAGILLGILSLTAPAFLLLVPFAVAWVVASRTGVRDRVRVAALLLATVTCCIAPWAVRNTVTMKEPVLVSTNGGFNLLLGNNPNATANSGVSVDLSAYEQRVEGLDEVERDRALRHFAIEWILEHPGDAASLYVRKVLNYFNFRTELATAANRSVWKDVLLAAT
jgi:4-amino-4-deoxy-L-arabinose transferase-like glycosyltransferase